MGCFRNENMTAELCEINNKPSTEVSSLFVYKMLIQTTYIPLYL